MRIRLLSPLGGRPAGATFDHDEAGAEALFAAGFAEPIEVIEPTEQHVTPTAPVEPVPPVQATPPAATTTKRARPARRG
ncbi:MAG: hypothetical protein ABIQ18_00515 [Umezawaea sp.]